MSVNTATAKKVSRTLRASPVKERSSALAREDIENLSAVTLAALGMAPAPPSSSSSQTRSSFNTTPDSSMAAATTPQPSERAMKRMSKMSSDMYATPPSTVLHSSKNRTVSSSSHLSTGSSSNINNNAHSSSARTRDRTTTASSVASSDVSSPNVQSTTAPLTAIRRPAPQIHHQNITPNVRSASGKLGSSSIKASPSSHLKMSTSGSMNSAVRSRKSSTSALASATRDTPSSIRSRAPSADAAKQAQRALQEEEKTQEKGVYVTQEEYSSLVALLSAKDNQISSLKDQVEEGKKELLGLKERNTKLQKERDSLIIEKKDLLKATAVSYNSNKDGSNTPQTGNAEEGMISRREYEQFKKQYEMQENLLEGFQRENEKATVELEALKKREKHLTEQLKKIYGPTFSTEIDVNPHTPDANGPSKRYPGSLFNDNGRGPSSPHGSGMMIGEQHRRRSGFGLSALSRASPLSQANEGITVEGEEEGENAKEAGAKTKMMDVEPAVLMEQLMSVQSLLDRFEKRLLVRESELIKKEKEATEQLEKLRTVVVM